MRCASRVQSAEFTTVVFEHGSDGDAKVLVEGQHPVVHEVAGRDRHVRRVDFGEGERARDVDDDLTSTYTLPAPFSLPPVECVLVERLAGTGRLYLREQFTNGSR